MKLKEIKIALKKNSEKEKALVLQNFFKTKKGEYGEKDIFLGVSVPKQRKIAKNFLDLSLHELQKLLNSKIHEERFIALIILIVNYKQEKKKKKANTKKIFDFYLKNVDNINNWDLVDISAPKIVGDYLLERKNERKILFKLANTKESKNSFDWLWRKRIAIISTLAFIKKNDFEEAIIFSKKFLKEENDLLHKATGWILREIGKKDEKILKEFLEKNYKKMPRTMLRYAIEKFSEKERKYYLTKK
ncbi:MAG: DNA alkylation repair protein [Candidatus ainarchaeum sp.]|nr:DNA alkylation repair protein [Candidatus ainarchaeum sp.]